MKKFVFLLGVLVVLLILVSYNKTDSKININNNSFNDVKDNNLAILLETKVGSGTYEESNINTWPSAGYIFNDVLSYCENGTTLNWNNDTKNVILKNVTKSDKCYVYFDKITFANYIKYLYTNDIESNIYYHNELLENGANDLSYRYYGGGYSLTDLGKTKYTTIYDLIYETCNNVKQTNNYWCSSSVTFRLEYDPNVSYSKLKDALNKAIKDGYVIKNDIKNYVCFGTDVYPCPNEKLYQIIGLFMNKDGQYEVKLIKAQSVNSNDLGTNGDYVRTSSNSTYLGNNDIMAFYKWNGKTTTIKWVESELNTINLNEKFLNSLGDWQTKIATHNWQVGGVRKSYGRNIDAKTAYDYELGDKRNNNTYEAPIGLIYISDFYYAVNKDYWTYPGEKDEYVGSIAVNQDYRAVNWNNWLWLGMSEWTITPENEGSSYVYNIDYAGLISATNVINNYSFAVRPVFYLNSSVEYSSGDGSETNPYRIN